MIRFSAIMHANDAKILLRTKRGIMFYTPKHCNECGEKIERSERKLTASSHFCENCEGEYKIVAWLPRMFFALSLLLALIGIGSGLKKNDQPLNVSKTGLVSPVTDKNIKSPEAPKQVETEKSSNQTAVVNSELSNKLPSDSANQQIAPVNISLSKADRQNQSAETVYYCGAQTKKGTPCSRRVKVRGQRCWQHTGQSSMLPSEQLVVKR